MNSGFSKDNTKAYENSMNILSESLLNIRTVAAYSMENKLYDIFLKNLEGPRQMIIRKSVISGLVFGVSQCMIFAIYALTFYIGLLFMFHGYVDFKSMYIAIFGLMFAAFGSGAASQYMPDVGKAKQAAREIFEIFDTKPLIGKNHHNIYCKRKYIITFYYI
jgi:ATP-binding cassette, subfamily B (MDR/TAP), member 1